MRHITKIPQKCTQKQAKTGADQPHFCRFSCSSRKTPKIGHFWRYFRPKTAFWAHTQDPPFSHGRAKYDLVPQRHPPPKKPANPTPPKTPLLYTYPPQTRDFGNTFSRGQTPGRLDPLSFSPDYTRWVQIPGGDYEATILFMVSKLLGDFFLWL